MKKKISIILTVRNEEAFIENCIKSIILFDKPSQVNVELLIIDGQSCDRTIEIARSFNNSDIPIEVLQNPRLSQASGFSIGVKHSDGDFVMWLGAHSEYPKNYLAIAFETIIRTKASYVGGIINTLPSGNSYSGRIVQALTTHPFGVGGSGFRTGRLKEGYSDTASYGIFEKKIFDKIGYFDERLIRAQDYEFNKRIIKSGGKIWLNPKMLVKYYNMPSFYSFLKKQFLMEAPYNAYMWYLAPYTFSFRHSITGAFAFGFLLGLVLAPIFSLIKVVYLIILSIYFFIAILSAIQLNRTHSNWKHIFVLPFAFFFFHFFHGVGILKGLFLLLINKSPVQKIAEPWSGYGKYRIKI
jgi:glycosyltransferase involved in cell wall biosynthesis